MADIQNIPEVLNFFRGETLPYRQVFDQLNASLPFTEAALVTSMPRGGLQIAQPPRLPENMTRVYTRDIHAHDKLTWQAFVRDKILRARDAWPGGQFETSRFFQEYLQANGFTYAAAAPLRQPVIDGYPGAIHLYRNSTQGAFQDNELNRLGEFARELDEAAVRVRHAREPEHEHHSSIDGRLHHDLPVRQFIFDSNLHSLVPQSDLSVLDERLRNAILDVARRRFEHVNGHESVGDRVSLPDSRGDLWNFRVVTYRSYPALVDGPVVFFCLQPDCAGWSLLRPADFAADPELSRLMPALKFMREQFHRGPTLVEIAKTVHLSPFHFHRRFTELLGITPKHFLLDCQIEQAKGELLARQKDLVKIATECGFAHQSHFTSRFKQATGLTPTRWRRMALESAGANASHN